MIFPALDRAINDRIPFLTYALVIVNTMAYVFFAFQSDAEGFVMQYGLLSSTREPHMYFSYQFLHANWPHLVGNMFFLWFFGSNVERRMGPILFAVAYTTAGIAAGGLWLALLPAGPGVPLVGASGSIAGLMGIYIVLFPGREITLVYWLIFWGGTVRLAAFWFLLIYVLQDLLNAMVIGQFSQVAHWAHVGGFGSGAILTLFIAKVLRVRFQPTLHGSSDTVFREKYEEFNYLPEHPVDAPSEAPPMAREVTTRIFRTRVPGAFALLAKAYVAPSPDLQTMIRKIGGEGVPSKSNCLLTTQDMGAARRAQTVLESMGIDTLLYPAREMLPDPVIVHAGDVACRDGFLYVRDEFDQTHSRPLKDIYLVAAGRISIQGKPRITIDLVIRRPLSSYRWKAPADEAGAETARALYEALRSTSAFTRSFHDLAREGKAPHRTFASDPGYTDYLVWAIQLLSTPFYRVQRAAKSA